MPRIVLFGATGFTGELTARAMRQADLKPLLLARDPARLEPLAEELGLEWATASVDDVDALRRLLSRGDTLVTTVGPFRRLGDSALRATIACGATYIDSSGEPAFVREVFDTWSPRAKRARIALIPACGYDNVPGHLAASLAIRAAPAATRVDIGYFVSGAATASGGTTASLLGAAFDQHYRFVGGALHSERGAKRMRRFAVDGRSRSALSMGGSEHLALPRQYPQLREVNLHLGWSDRLSRPASVLSGAVAGFTHIPGMTAAISRLALGRGSRGGPGPESRRRSGSHVVAVARDEAGAAQATVRVVGGDGYDFTAAILAWAAEHAVDIRSRGALGPVEAFGVDALLAGVRQTGMTVSGSGIERMTPQHPAVVTATGGTARSCSQRQDRDARR